MGTLHIGAAGELLVQYQLLKLNVDSARLTTDSGIDLVAYSPLTGNASTIQVKTMQKPTPSGGRGRLAVNFDFRHDLRADLLAIALLSTDQVWLLTLAEAHLLAQQHTEAGSRKLYFYMDEDIVQKAGVPLKIGDMVGYLLEERAGTFFPS